MKNFLPWTSISLFVTTAAFQAIAQSTEEQGGTDTPRCYGIIAAVGEGRTSSADAAKARAMSHAEALWMARVRFDYGEHYMDLKHAENVRHVCTSWSIPSDIEVTRESRCKMWARPCRSPLGAFDLKIERSPEKDDDD